MRERAGAVAHPMSRRVQVVRLQPGAKEMPVALPSLTLHGSHLDRLLLVLLNTEGDICAGRVLQGDCILLFTSEVAAAAFADQTGVEARPPLVFSRSRQEFLLQARRSSAQGFVGALIDPNADARETAFVGFHVDRRQGGPGSPSS
jgi:hypothetical protein